MFGYCWCVYLSEDILYFCQFFLFQFFYFVVVVVLDVSE